MGPGWGRLQGQLTYCEESDCKDNNKINNNYENFSMFCKKKALLCFFDLPAERSQTTGGSGCLQSWVACAVREGKLVYSTTCQVLFERLLTLVYLHVKIGSLQMHSLEMVAIRCQSGRLVLWKLVSTALQSNAVLLTLPAQISHGLRQVPGPAKADKRSCKQQEHYQKVVLLCKSSRFLFQTQLTEGA